MCTYKEMNIELPNGKTVKEVNDAVRSEVERIYRKAWRQGVSVPFFDDEGNIYLANPDGSEDRVSLDRNTHTFRVLHRTEQPGKGRHSHLVTSLNCMQKQELRPELTIIAGPNKKRIYHIARVGR